MGDYFTDTPHVYLPAQKPDQADKRWVITQECAEDLAELKKKDIDAWRNLLSLMQRYAREGAPTSGEGEDGRLIPTEYELDAPVGDHFTPKLNGPKPWLGELRIEMTTREIGGGKPYRLYFGDLCDAPNESVAQMLAVSGSEKWISRKGADRTRVKQQQDRDMERAMKRIIHWCGKNNRTYRGLGN